MKWSKIKWLLKVLHLQINCFPNYREETCLMKSRLCVMYQSMSSLAAHLEIADAPCKDDCLDAIFQTESRNNFKEFKHKYQISSYFQPEIFIASSHPTMCKCTSILQLRLGPFKAWWWVMGTNQTNNKSRLRRVVKQIVRWKTRSLNFFEWHASKRVFFK